MSYLQRADRDSGAVPGCPFGNFTTELGPRDAGVRAAVDAVSADMRSMFADAIRGVWHEETWWPTSTPTTGGSVVRPHGGLDDPRQGPQ